MSASNGNGRRKPKQPYTDAQKADALAALDANGGNQYKTARQIGVPRKTLAEWANGRHTNVDVATMRQGKQVALAERLEMLANLLLDALPGKLDSASAKDAAITLGIALDKMQLLRGEPTSIHESLSEDERAARVAELLDAARARRDGPAANGRPAR